MPDTIPIRAATAPGDQLPGRDRVNDSPNGFSVADLCRRWKVGADKVHAFLRSGELTAINLATNLSGRPLYRVSPEAVEAFERRRSSAPTPKPKRRRRQPELVDYWPEP